MQFYLNAWCNSCHLFGFDIMNFYRYLFIAIMFLFVLFVKIKDPLRAMFIASLFFFTFTSGIATQYLIIPIIFGVFFESKWFYFYSIVVALSFIGGLEPQLPFILPALSVVSWNDVWIFSILWFGSELYRTIKSKEIFYV